MTKKTRVTLGDREAQKAITARRELLPCPLCGVDLRNHPPSRIHFHEASGCLLDRVGIPMEKAREWNTRPPLLTPTQKALLGIAREPRKFEEGIK